MVQERDFDVTEWGHRGITYAEELLIENLVTKSLSNDFERRFINSLMNELAACELSALSAKQRVILWSIAGRYRNYFRDPIMKCLIEQIEIYAQSASKAQRNRSANA